jgi:vitamin B12/bleomycin/antimicrobial peptide transport system ATP-binding/permease protein
MSDETVEKRDKSAETIKNKALVRRFWRTARHFWWSNERQLVWWLTGGLVALVVCQLFIQYRINVWNRAIFDALEKKDGATLLTQTAIFIPLAVVSIIIAVLIVFARMRLQRRWRLWMTNDIVGRWLTKGRYYQLNLVPGDHQNPEHRIGEDTRIATEQPVDFAVGILTAVLTGATFMGVLWQVGGSMTVNLGGSEIVIPGFLVIAVIIYALVISTSMVFIARSFIPVMEAKNQSEAEFRYALTRLRENGESIAILGGEQEERAGLDKLLGTVIRRWIHVAGQYMRTTSVSHGNFLVASVIPVLLSSPKYLAGQMTLGEVMQAAAAFIQVQYAFNWIVDNYPRLAEWTASARRVAVLLAAIDDLERIEEGGKNAIIQRKEDEETAALRLRGLSVTLNDGTIVVDDADARVELGERVLVAGESGTGKSTLVRAIAGLWPWGEGEISIKRGAKLLLMPQRPYLPLGTLRRAAAYPKAPEEIEDDEMKKTFEMVGLGHLAERLDEDNPWDRVLSGGEQQRLGFVRLLLHKPDIVVMDEATSALDTASQTMLMERLSELLPETAIISVGHRPELEAFHSRKLNLLRREGGARLVPGDILAPPISPLGTLMTRWRPSFTRRLTGQPQGPKVEIPPDRAAG